MMSTSLLSGEDVITLKESDDVPDVITLQKVMPGWHHFGKSDAGVASLYEKPLALLASFGGTTGINVGIVQ